MLPPQTPSVVRIETGTGFPATLVASILGPHDRMVRLRDGPMAGDLHVSHDSCDAGTVAAIIGRHEQLVVRTSGNRPGWTLCHGVKTLYLTNS